MYTDSFSVIINMRNTRKSRAVSISRDGGSTWSRPWYIETLPEPTCSAGLINTPIAGATASPSSSLGEEVNRAPWHAKMRGGWGVREQEIVGEACDRDPKHRRQKGRV